MYVPSFQKKPEIRWIRTGAPSLAAQLAGQLRTASGMSFGGVTAPVEIRRDEVVAGKKPALTFADKLLLWLRDYEHAELPSFASIRDELDFHVDQNYAAHFVSSALIRLSVEGYIDVWVGKLHGHPGAYVIRMRDSGRVMRTKGSPLDVFPE